MPEIGMFPLGIVLLPTEQLPLHIFEPRYRELIEECIDQDCPLGVVFEHEEESAREVGTLAEVAEVVHRFDDGRLNIVVTGLSRFRIVRWTEGRAFRTAEVEALEDEDDSPRPGAGDQALSLFGRLAEDAGAEVEVPAAGSAALSFELAARIDFAADVKQELLESRSERDRLDRVIELLEHEVHTLAVEREVTARAATNGKVFAPKG